MIVSPMLKRATAVLSKPSYMAEITPNKKIKAGLLSLNSLFYKCWVADGHSSGSSLAESARSLDSAAGKYWDEV